MTQQAADFPPNPVGRPKSTVPTIRGRMIYIGLKVLPDLLAKVDAFGDVLSRDLGRPVSRTLAVTTLLRHAVGDGEISASPTEAAWRPIKDIPAVGTFLVAFYEPTAWAYRPAIVRLWDGMSPGQRRGALQWARAWMPAPVPPTGAERAAWVEAEIAPAGDEGIEQLKEVAS